MTLTFHIDYHTEWGEEVRISGNIPELGSHEAAQAVPLHTADGTHWEVTLEVAASALCPISYEYSIYRAGKAVRTEWNTLPRTLSLPDGRAHCHLRDSWRELPEESYLYTSAFTDVILARPTRDALPVPSSGQLVIRADAPGVESNCRLAVCGNQSALGNWDATHALPMNDARFPCWEVEIDVAQLVFPVEYKFVICRTDNHQVVAWEAGDNRTILSWPVADDDTLVITLGHIPFALPRRKEAGVAIPVFSLRSNHSFGIGDFGDLRLLIDWAALTGQRIVQILPINDTTATHTRADSYPYNAISIYALHPMYVDFTQMPRLKDAALQAAFDSKQTALNALPTVDYETVEQAKWEYLHRLYEQEGEGTLSAAAFRTFVSENDTWLSPYTHFCCERDADKYDADFYAYIQYHLHLQLLAATHHARACGIVLKGDIPIGISRYSVSATVEPELFNMEGQAGAPPDDFAVDGQNWGFPTYRWDVMARDGYRWWQNRFRKMAEYFDAYRIDHILGFFR
ncbi:MAG: 4-alpha-glucanotransferase, partial [Prevotellaceae bacterium]|nr:4-alpha-glucanotransferase [Prevotellaceae bacterium]